MHEHQNLRPSSIVYTFHPIDAAFASVTLLQTGEQLKCLAAIV